MAKPKVLILDPVRPNAGLTARYRKKIMARVDAMHRSCMYWIKAAYNQNEPKIVALAKDAAPADMLKKVVDELTDRWMKNFDVGARELAEYFSQAAYLRSEVQLKAILKKAGFSVEFQMTSAMKDIIAASVHENVALIKSIPQQYFKNLEGSVMRSVQTGRDVGGLVKDLQQNYGVTKRRAQLISRDQNNKATASMQRARQLELGIKEAIWMHSSAGKVPRPSHLKNNGQRYDVAKGWYDPEVSQWIHPGQLINCRCTSRPVIEGFI